MKAWTWVLVFLLPIVGMVHPLDPVVAAPSPTLAIPGQPPAFHGGYPVLVAGIWHDLTLVAPGGAWDVTLALPGAAAQNESSYYHWRGAQGWVDAAYGHYLDPTNSSLSSQGFALRLGVDGRATPGAWALTVMASGVAVVNATVEVVEARASASFSGDYFALRVDPYSPGRLDGRVTGQGFRMYNDGNVPLEVEVAFDHYGDLLSVTGVPDLLGVGHLATGSLILDAPSWSPRLIHLQATLTARAGLTVPPRDGSRVLPQLQIPFGVEITVAHEGSSLGTLGSTAYEWPRTATAGSDGRVELRLYLDGAEDVELTVATTNAQLLSLTVVGRASRNPALLSLQPGFEAPVVVDLLLPGNRGGQVTFTLRSLATLNRTTFTTTLTAGPAHPPQGTPSDYTLPLGTAAIAAVGAGAVAFAARSRWEGHRGRRRGPARGRGNRSTGGIHGKPGGRRP